MAFYRADRVGPLVLEEISAVLLGKLEDPRLSGLNFIKVKMTRDLRIAHVYFVISGGEEKAASALEALDRARGIFKKAIGRNLNLRLVPDLEFHYDRNLDHAGRIETILKEIHEQQTGSDEESD